MYGLDMKTPHRTPRAIKMAERKAEKAAHIARMAAIHAEVQAVVAGLSPATAPGAVGTARAILPRMTNTKDILTVIAERDASPARPAVKHLVKRYQVRTDARALRPLLTYRRAQRAVRLCKRMGVDAYASPMMVRA